LILQDLWLENNLNNKRFLVKLSGEFLLDANSGLSLKKADDICSRLASIIKSGFKLGFVIGGGNIFRGAFPEIKGYNRLLGDQIGMMATIVNALTLTERLRAYDIPVILQSGIKVEGVAGLFNKETVEEYFNKGGCAVFCGGIGNPYFSTDTTSALRALQINADYVIKATKVDGIYDKDPVKNKDARMYDSITFDEIIQKKLEVMDLTAMLLMKKNNLKLKVINFNKSETLEKACRGEKIGTCVEE
jgi:uridylate kinase